MIEIIALVLSITFYLFRATVPILKYPFIILYFGLIIDSIINRRSQIASAFKGFFRDFYLSVFLALILFVSFSLSSKQYLIIFKDIINAIILISMFFLMRVHITSKKDLHVFYKNLIRLIIFFALLISALLLFNFLKIFQSDYGLSSNKFDWNSLFRSLSTDYNFGLLPVFFGIIGVLYFLQEPSTLLKKGFLNLILIIYVTTILLSGSRRGLILFITIITILLFIKLFTHIKKSSSLKKIGSNSELFLISSVFLTFLLIGFLFIIPIQMKRNILNTLGITATSYKHILSPRLYRYSTIFSAYEYSHYQNIIWDEQPDKKNPDTGWGTRTSTFIHSLIGENVEIVPKNSIGYRMDNTCNASTWNNNAYSYTNISSLFQGDSIKALNEFYYASVYCFVSKDFDGTWARISAEGGAYGKIIQQYDLNNKGVWQKLSICFKNEVNISPVYLYWAKDGVIDFSSLNGYIIYAHPEYKIIKSDPKDPETGWGLHGGTFVYPLIGDNVETIPENSVGLKIDRTCYSSTWYNNAYSYTDISILLQWDTLVTNYRVFYASVYCFVSKDFNGKWARISTEGDVSGNIINEYDLSKKGTWQKLQIDFNSKSKSKIPPVYLYLSKFGVKDFSSLDGYVIFAYPQYKMNTKKNIDKSFLNYPLKNRNVIDYDIEKYDKIYFPGNDIKQLNGINTLMNRFYDLKSKNIPLYLSQLIKNSTNNYQFEAGIFAFTVPELTILSIGMDYDPIRKWASKFISEDTTYYGYKKNLITDTISNEFIGSRLLRWEFTWQIFTKEYNCKQKIFGGGFNFLNWFGYRFLKDKTASDYPHNPFLSVLLYSGILGLIIYMFFFYKALYYYIKYQGEYPILFIFFIITFFFSFFSAGSPFDPPIMGFFMLLPFFIHHIHKNSERINQPIDTL